MVVALAVAAAAMIVWSIVERPARAQPAPAKTDSWRVFDTACGAHPGGHAGCVTPFLHVPSDRCFLVVDTGGVIETGRVVCR
jgi:hypothetical protein